nr:hypothetical protein [Tanacetum cinerariifolium]
MITRSQSGIVKPIDCLSLHTFSIFPIPKNLSHAWDPNWRNAIYDEYNVLVKNGTWLLLPRPAGVDMVRSMWLFKHKFHADETLSRYKTRLVANDSSQQLGVDFDETFSPVIKPTTIRMVLSLIMSQIFIWTETSTSGLASAIIGSLNNEFDMIDLEALNYFLGISVNLTHTCLFLSQKKYALQLLEHAHMVTCNPSRTPVDTEFKLGLECAPVQDPTLYRSLAGGSGCPSTRRSTSGYCVFLGDNLLSWSAKRQHTLSRSIVEAEYRGVANVVAETAWLRNLLHELHSPLSTTTLVYCNNVSAIYMSANPVQHHRTKHIEIDIHFV